MTMTDTEAKALALTNEVRRDKGRGPYGAAHWPKREESESLEALCRAIEREAATEARHAAELRELKERFSEVLGQIKKKCIPFKVGRTFDELAAPFIIPAPDPLVEAIKDVANPDYDCASPEAYADVLRAAIEARGGKIVWEAGE